MSTFTEIALSSGKSIKFYVNTSVLQWRVKTFFTKEPETLKWLDSLLPGSVLFDVGANVGMYSIYAAARGLRVHAFEPEALNFATLAKNVHLNGVGQNVSIWPIAFSDREGFDTMYLSQFSTGGSCHSVGDDVDFNLHARTSPAQQGVYTTSIDKFVESSPGGMVHPRHIKIDVDGFEHRVLDGAMRTLRDVESLCIELNPRIPQHVRAIQYLKAIGFGVDPEQVERSTRTDGAFKGVAEYVFRR